MVDFLLQVFELGGPFTEAVRSLTANFDEALLGSRLSSLVQRVGS